MDDIDLLKMSGVSASGIILAVIGYKVIKAVMNKKLTSNCCGKKFEVGIAVSQQEISPKPSPKPSQIDLENPMPTSKKAGATKP